MLMNPSVNIGSYWYIIIEMFKDHLIFLKYFYLLEQAICCALITIHINKTFDVIEQ